MRSDRAVSSGVAFSGGIADPVSRVMTARGLVDRHEAAVYRLQRQHVIAFVADETAQRAAVLQSALARQRNPARSSHPAREARGSARAPSSGARCSTGRVRRLRRARARCDTSRTALCRRRTRPPAATSPAGWTSNAEAIEGPHEGGDRLEVGLRHRSETEACHWACHS